MINYKHFIEMLNEGLITTHSINFLQSQLINLINLVFKKGYYLFDDDDVITLRIYDKLTKSQVELILYKIKISGYFISIVGSDIKLKKETEYDNLDIIETEKDLDKLDFENINSWYFQIEKKFEKKENYTGKIYHITKQNKIKKINKNGLVPKHSNKKLHHPDRIYFYKDDNNIKMNLSMMIKQFKELDNSEYCIIELDVNDINCYKDINSEGFYTTGNIHPKNIINIFDYEWKIIN